MGVTGLWTVVQPCARPVKLETLNRKRLAVDASIWIYQFLKAVRDKEGNALRNSHVVGFFRRICKLLYFGIKPVFVFDGGAPILKRQTIAGRKKRREGRREDAVRTAGKLLAVQMQRLAQDEETKRKDSSRQPQEEEVPDNAVYVDEVFMTDKERQQNRRFRKKDAYHLPDMDVSFDKMGAPEDPRIMSHEELEEYARQFHSGEEINLYDFSKIDFDSPFFLSLPATDRYNILNAARLRSRLRMGYSKEQLDVMFPDRMAFSKFQIERVKERNDLTQRLMNINGMNGEEAMYGNTAGQRIAGERGREYVLVKNNDVEGGWALGVVGNEGHRERPIDVDRDDQQVAAEDENWTDDEDGFEDVPVEGLNRLPKIPALQRGVFDRSLNRHAQEMAPDYEDIPRDIDDNSLFVEGAPADHAVDGHGVNELFEGAVESENEDLQRAIQMSLQAPDDLVLEEPLDNRPAPPAAGKEEATASPPESDDEMDFASALARSRKSQPRPKPRTAAPRIDNPFGGPLPFESLKISTKETRKDTEGGKESDRRDAELTKPPKKQPLPPWFAGDDEAKRDFINEEEREESLETYRQIAANPGHEFLTDYKSPGVIDADKMPDSTEVVDLEDDSERLHEDTKPVVPKPSVRMDDIAEQIRAEPPLPTGPVTEELPVSRDVAPFGTGIPKEELDSVIDESSAGAYDRPTRSASVTGIDAAYEEGRSPSPEFEDVQISAANAAEPAESTPAAEVLPDPQEYVEDTTDVLVEEAEDYSDPEDEDLMRQLAAEAEEHARFASTLNSKSQAENILVYEEELKQLRSQHKKDRRDADEVSHIMVTECQQLLTLFGLPYITAPMEAEAQCAELVSLGLVDGIVTDDSDIFLFGGTRVYKNMFNQSKYVECYLASDLEKEYALDRNKLIQFAHLLGSDYTEGIPGVGPVTALEILTEFSSLEEFRDWWTQVQMGVQMPDDSHAAFYKKFKKHASKLFLPPSFPDRHVDDAYLEPEVDSDPSPFQWGVPDLNALRNFLMATIGWDQQRTDEVLVPVIRDMNQREQEGTQSNITNFFSGTQGAGAFAPRVRPDGKGRMEKAFRRLRQEAVSRQQPETGGSDIEQADGERPDGESTPETGSNDGSQGRAKRRAPRRGQTTESAATPKRRRTAANTE
ncbi:DNA excision repair protein Rad2 [Paecilomyces variotii No. 5]|uniref:DNA excision repair protein Rad2 n=1 Tax=Byssochlamys spectabilis (strain No. 5 / NBRC 109023) TaxID=1356009 RepID=V5FZ15_BYSSN|nr:DNA excision repair protein Rad2 [Paecilomyces variotii No. 5]